MGFACIGPRRTRSAGSNGNGLGGGESPMAVESLLSYRPAWYAPRSDEEVLLEGLLRKRSRHLQAWRLRWAALTTQSLCFFEEPGHIQGVPTEHVKLSDVVGVALKDDSLLIRLPYWRCSLQFDEVAVAENWAECLLDCVD